jgi:hypothetical protein
LDDDELFQKCWESYKLTQSKTPDRSSNGIDTWFKNEEGVDTVTICGRTTINASMLKVLAILAEVDLMSKFMDRFDEIKKIEEYSLFRWLVRIKIRMPVTIANREILLVGFGTPIPDTQSCILPFRSISSNFYGMETPKEDPNYKRIEVNFGGFHIKYIDENNCELCNFYNVDPKIPLVPFFVVNTFIKELSYYVLYDIRSQLEAADENIYKERMEDNKQFYEKIITTINSKVIEK